MSRIDGLDLARALAIIGMIAAHLVGSNIITEGYPSVLFAVLAGVSAGIIADRPRLIIRGVLLIALGLLLDPLPHFIRIVLVPIGVVIIVLGLLYKRSTQFLIIVVVILLCLGIPLQLWLGDTYGVPLINSVYPLNAWIIYGIAGLLIRRYLLTSSRTQWITLGESAVVMVIGLLIHASSLVYANIAEDSFFLRVLSPQSHSGGFLDIVFSASASIFVISACLLLCRNTMFDKIVYPLRAMGSMSLTSYVLHVLSVTVALVAGFIVAPEEDPPVFDFTELMWGTIIAIIVFSCIWRVFFKRGPLEATLRLIIEAIAPSRDASVGSKPPKEKLDYAPPRRDTPTRRD